MAEQPKPSYSIDDSELRVCIERLADALCSTVRGDFDHLIHLDVADESLDKLQMLVNFVLDSARRAKMARFEAERLSRENVLLIEEVGRVREMGSYELESLLGRGGMGEVWRGRHRMLAQPAAIKLIHPRKIAGADSHAAHRMLLRFRREAQATAALRSPHTIQVYDFGVSDGAFYYVMELLDGLDLETLVRLEGALPQSRAIHLLIQACHSLEEAHQAGMIHRDIKPSNLFACRYGIDVDFLKVLDFGLVKIAATPGETETIEGAVTGTPAYVAPEQVMEVRNVDRRADIYSLGCTAYWLLAGHPVFDSSNPTELIFRHVQEQPLRLTEAVSQSIDAELDDIVMSCLEKKPANRPSSAAELADRLRVLGLSDQWTDEDRRMWWQNRPTLRIGEEKQ